MYYEIVALPHPQFRSLAFIHFPKYFYKTKITINLSLILLLSNMLRLYSKKI